MRDVFLPFVLACLLAGCATSRYPDVGGVVWTRMQGVPFEKRGELYGQLLREGVLTQTKYNEMYGEWQGQMPRWTAEQNEKRARARALASLTPMQRLDLEMRQKELDFRRTQYNSQMAQRAAQEKRARTAAALNMLAGTMNQVSAQMREDQRRQEDFNRALILQRMRNQNPRTYDSTVTPTYPGGPVRIHTEETGGY